MMRDSSNDWDGLSVRWRGVHVSISGKDALRDCSGSAETGTLTAVMGASGAGKTTLINALSRRGACTSGVIRYGEEPGEPWSRRLKTQVGYVAQDDAVYEELTVREMLSFAAQLRLAAPEAERRARTEAVLEELQLTKCADTLIGNSHMAERRGISGGERKRLCVASELLGAPRLLFCDEPTSGLDSAMALVLTQRLRALCSERGITVIASIHQPSSQIFGAFDALTLLHAGRTVYRGPPAGAAARFAQLSGDGCPDGWSHADWVLDLVSQGGLTNTQLDAAAAACAAEGALLTSGGRAVGSGGGARAAGAREAGGSDAEVYANGLRQEAAILLRREWRLTRPTLWSNESGVMHLCNALIVTIMYLRTGYAEQDIFARYSACWMLVMFWSFFPFIASAATLSQDVLVKLRKELEVGAYRVSTRFAVVSGCSLLGQLVYPALFTPIFYWGARLSDDPGTFAGVCVLVALNIAVFHGLGTLIVVLFPERALTALLTFMTFIFSFSGFFKPLRQTPFPWLGYANPVCYTTDVVTRIVFSTADTYTAAAGADAPRLTRADVLAMHPVALPAVPNGACVLVLVGMTVASRLGACALLVRRMRKLLLTHQHGDATATAATAAAAAPNGKAARGEGGGGGDGAGDGAIDGGAVRSGSRGAARARSHHTRAVVAPRSPRAGRMLADDAAAAQRAAELADV